LVGRHHKAVTGAMCTSRCGGGDGCSPRHAATLTIISEPRSVDTAPRNYGTPTWPKSLHTGGPRPTKIPGIGAAFGTNDWPFQVINHNHTTSPLLDRPAHIGSSARSSSSLRAVTDPVVRSSPPTGGKRAALQVAARLLCHADPGNEFDASTVAPWIAAYNKLKRLGRPHRIRPRPGSCGSPPKARASRGKHHPPVYSLSLGRRPPTKDPTTTRPRQPASTTALEAAAQPAFLPGAGRVVGPPEGGRHLTGSGKGFTDSSGTGCASSFYGP